MKTLRLGLTPEKFVKYMTQNLRRDTFSRRFVLPQSEEFCGEVTDRSFYVLRRGKYVFPFFSVVLRGNIVKDGDGITVSYRYSRPPLTTFILDLCAAVFLLTGASFADEYLPISVLFFVIALFSFLPTVIFSRRAKRRLTEFIADAK